VAFGLDCFEENKMEKKYSSRVEREVEKDNEAKLNRSLLTAIVLIIIFIFLSSIFLFWKQQYIQCLSSTVFFLFLLYYVKKGYKDLSKVDSLNIIVKYIFIVAIFDLVFLFPNLLDLSSYFSVALMADVVIYIVKIYWHKTGQIEI
jgi:cation transport ATPase